MGEVPLQATGAPGGSREKAHRVTSLIRDRHPVGPYRRPMPRVIGCPGGVGGFSSTQHRRTVEIVLSLMSEVPL